MAAEKQLVVYKPLQLSLDDKFFKRVREELRRKQPIEVKTPYESVERVPKIIRNFFALWKSRFGAVVDPKSGKFIPNTTTSFSHKHATLMIYGSAATGAVIGGATAGPFGVAVGACTGFAAGMSASAFVHGGYDISLEIDVLGKLTVRISPMGGNAETVSSDSC